MNTETCGACRRLCTIHLLDPSEMSVISAPALASVIELTLVPCATMVSDPARATTSAFVDVMAFASSVIVRLCPGLTALVAGSVYVLEAVNAALVATTRSVAKIP